MSGKGKNNAPKPARWGTRKLFPKELARKEASNVRQKKKSFGQTRSTYTNRKNRNEFTKPRNRYINWNPGNEPINKRPVVATNNVSLLPVRRPFRVPYGFSRSLPRPGSFFRAPNQGFLGPAPPPSPASIRNSNSFSKISTPGSSFTESPPPSSPPRFEERTLAFLQRLNNNNSPSLPSSKPKVSEAPPPPPPNIYSPQARRNTRRLVSPIPNATAAAVLGNNFVPNTQNQYEIPNMTPSVAPPPAPSNRYSPQPRRNTTRGNQLRRFREMNPNFYPNY